MVATKLEAVMHPLGMGLGIFPKEVETTSLHRVCRRPHHHVSFATRLVGRLRDETIDIIHVHRQFEPETIPLPSSPFLGLFEFLGGFRAFDPFSEIPLHLLGKFHAYGGRA